MTNLINNKNRIQFSLKLTEDNHEKVRIESAKIWLTMSAFIWMLITTYNWVDITFKDKNNIS